MSEFSSVPIVPIDSTVPSGQQIVNFRELSVGAGSDIFKVNKDGLFLGAVTFADAPFKVTFQGVATATGLVIVSGTIRAGQTAYNTGTGYWIGTDSGTPKFSIGNGSTKYLTWDGSALSIRGTLNADDITAGTLTGRTVKAVGTGVASDVWMDGEIGELAFYYGGVKIADFYCDTSGRILLTTNQDIYLEASSGDIALFGDLVTIVSDSDLTCVFNDDGGGDSARWINDSSLTMEHRDNGDLAISGSYL